MKYAFYPGCVAKSGAPELFQSASAVIERLGIETVELESAACTGAGVLQERNEKLGDALNVRTFALAEQMGLPIMTICSTCQGVMSQAHKRVMRDPDYLAEINGILAEEGLEYKGTTVIKHLLRIMVEEIGVDRLQEMFTRELSGLKLAPFYGCYILRPSDALGFDEHPERQDSLERLIKATGAENVDFSGKTKCCGFPILLINQENSMKMVSQHTGDAKDLGADAMVTPCPLCHLNLDGYQPKAAKNRPSGKIDLPILHMPQMIGLAMGMQPKELGLQRHIISPGMVAEKAAT
ncbi:MAG: CoB--CoM heterodisulfide reductase iron-sulfur subunit B family protein [Chloroflexota bacterium]